MSDFWDDTPETTPPTVHHVYLFDDSKAHVYHPRQHPSQPLNLIHDFRNPDSRFYHEAHAQKARPQQDHR